MNAVRSLVSLLAVALLATTIPAVSAAPFGESYSVRLDFSNVLPGQPDEGHVGAVTFDALPDSVPGAGGPGVSPNDLVATETLFPPTGPSGIIRSIEIVLEGQDPAQPFPAPGAPLFTTTFGAGPVTLEVGGIFWTEPLQTVLNANLFGGTPPEFTISFPTEPSVTAPLNFTGMGTAGDPFTLTPGPSLDITDFVSGAERANRVTVRLSVVTVIPEPTTIMLLTGATTLLARRRGARR